MKKFALSALAGIATVSAFAQPVFNSFNFENGSTFFTTIVGTAPTGTSLADDMVWQVAPGMTTFTLDRLRYIIGTRTGEVAPFTSNQRFRFYDLYDDTATGATPAVDTPSLTITTTGLTLPVAGGNYFVTTTIAAATTITIDPTVVKGFSQECFADNTFTAYNTKMQFGLAYGNGLPNEWSLQGWLLDAAASPDGLYTGAEFTNFGPPADHSAIGLMVFPRGIKVTGTVTLSNYLPAPSVKDAYVEVLPMDESVVLHRGWVALSATGAYEGIVPIENALGQYKVRVRSKTWLSEVATVDTTGFTPATPITNVNFTLRNGDCDFNNIVDIADYTILSAAFSGVLDEDPVTAGNQSSANWDVRADLDGSNIVDIADYTILSANFSGVGN